ncbi:hypothetical protein PTT_15507 [Pyrenophora teres f. teres 0-1]|uniref:Uncharacterized protein n=1 Tax=Pyrenophora teres f. teres (strain 0-1) TaxID=861557 RepID=E3S0D4_PYRTT|nr:hypothetical protein PTT_15507 [Pyrenophora teres f. teres 0-1]
MIEKLNGPGDGIHIGALFKETSQYYNPNAKRDLLYNSKKDEEENSDEEPEDSGDEEKNSEDEWVEDLSALQVKHEEKAQSIRMSMSLDKPARLGDLPGNWTLYSLQALKACAETPHGYYVDEDWTAGELEIMDPDPDDYPIFYNTNLNLTGSELYWLGMCLSVPKFASSTSVREIGSGNDGNTISPDLYYVAVREKSIAERFHCDYDYKNSENYEQVHEYWKRLEAEYEANGGDYAVSDADSEKSWETEDEWTDEE